MLKTRKKLLLYALLALVVSITTLYVLNPICRYIYTKDFVEKRDKQLAEIFSGNLEEIGLSASEKPIFFMHSAETITNGSCLDLSSGKYDIFSIFSVAERLDYNVLEASQYIITHLNNWGYHYHVPTEEDYAIFLQEVKADTHLWKAFPWYDGILELPNCIIVELTQIEINW